MEQNLPVVVIGGGPVGLATAAHLLARGLTPLVLEAGSTVGAGMLRWAHVRMFSPWAFAIDRAAGALLARHGWSPPNPAELPTGGEIVERYLRPLAATPEMAPHIRTGTRVLAVTKEHRDRMKDAGRKEAPFVVRYSAADGEAEVLARAVIDASGTIETPNPLGASGIPARGERTLTDRIFYGMPDVLSALRSRYAGKRVLVVGSGHSAFNVLSDLARLREEEPTTRIEWAIRRPALEQVLGGGEDDQLQERGRLGLVIQRLFQEGALNVTTHFYLDALELTDDGVVAHGNGRALPAVDEIVAATGFRPDRTLLAELRLALDAGTESPVALAPLIDPNLHSCGTVRPHGAEELKHPDSDVFIVGMKSYGRAPTFLLLTGYEQVRSVVAAIAGDWEAARQVELVLPETGVCTTSVVKTTASSCCGGPASTSDACCAEDEEAKAQGESGCGCGATPSLPLATVAPSETSNAVAQAACC